MRMRLLAFIVWSILCGMVSAGCEQQAAGSGGIGAYWVVSLSGCGVTVVEVSVEAPWMEAEDWSTLTWSLGELQDPKKQSRTMVLPFDACM